VSEGARQSVYANACAIEREKEREREEGVKREEAK